MDIYIFATTTTQIFHGPINVKILNEVRFEIFIMEILLWKP